MMANITILVGSALLGGLASVYFSDQKKINYSLLLTFSGGYLFAITIIHILPHLFRESEDITATGVLVLGGYYLQQFLEYLTTGAEHGHVHLKDARHQHKSGLAISLLVGLSVHAFLEGSLLTESPLNPSHSHNGAVAIGIGLHKLPAAFAMMSILLCYYKTKTKPFLFLALFSLASPIGLVLSQWAVNQHVFTLATTQVLFALVSGSFLYISTTIVFESTPGHKFKANKFILVVLGGLTAVAAELVL